MKKSLLIFACGLVCSVLATDVTVKTSVEGGNNPRTQNECKTKARKLAIVKYVKGLGVDVGDSLIAKAESSYKKYTDNDVENKGDWDYDDGEMTADLIVTVNDEAVLQWLKGEGVTLNQGGAGNGAVPKYDIVVAEELPDKGLIKMAEAMGTGLDGKAFFLTRYTMFQKRVRDALGKKINEIGLGVKQLEDDPAYEEFKKNDPALVGGTFDPDVGEKGDWKLNHDFVNQIRNTNPNTVLLYYRLDSIVYEATKKRARVSVSLKVKDLDGNVTALDLGAKDYLTGTLDADQPDSVVADIAVTVIRAVGFLLNGEDLNGKMMAMFKSISSAAKKPKGPMKLVVNVSSVDKKIRTRFKLALKKELIAAGLTDQEHVKSAQDTLTATVIKEDIPGEEDLWGAVLEVLDKCGIEATDDQKTFKNGVMTVTPGK